MFLNQTKLSLSTNEIIRLILVASVSLLTRVKLIINETQELKLQNFYPMFSSATFGTLFNLFTFLAYSKGGSVGVVDAINNSTVFFVIILELIILKDQSNLVKKIICSIIATTGILILSQVK